MGRQFHGKRSTSEDSLVGRQAELALLRDGLRRAADGSTSVVLVSGEPGIGKTRLLDEFTGEATRDGSVVLRGVATQAEGMPPYFPFVDALGRYVRVADPDQLRDQVGDAAGILSTVVPDLHRIVATPPPSYPLPPEHARYRLYEAVGELLTTIAADHVLILALDDLQWVDQASMDLILHLARRGPDARVMIVGAYRKGEVEQNHALVAGLAELSRLRVLTTITLKPFSDEDTMAIASAYLGGDLGETASGLLQERSEGNPFIAEELLRAWREGGVLERRGAGWEVVTSRSTDIPDTVTAAIRYRLDRLPPETVELLRTAAVIGRTFDSKLLAQTLGQEDETVEEQLRAAQLGAVVRYSAEHEYSFAHDLIREHLYAEVTPIRRKRLHGFIGHSLEVQPGSRDAKRDAVLAFHFGHSGDRSRAAVYAECAAKAAMDTYAFAEAVSYYRTAVKFVDARDAQRAALLLALGDAAILAGSESDAVPHFEEARRWFIDTGDHESAARAAHGLGRAWWRQDKLAEAEGGFAAAAELLRDRESALAVGVLVDRGSLLAVSLGKQEDGIVQARRALEIAQRLGEDRLVASASRALGNLLVRGNRFSEGLPLLERALVLAEEAEDSVEAAECCACLVLAYKWSGALRRSLEMIDRRLMYAERTNDLYQLRHAHTWRVASAMGQGNWDEADRILDEAQAIAEPLAGTEPLAFVYNMRGAVAWFRGDYVGAEAWFTRSTTMFRDMGPTVLVWYLAPLGITQLTLGKRSAALACMAEVEILVDALPPGTIHSADPLVYLSIMTVMLGDRERAESYYARLLPFSGLHIDFLVDRILGELATLLGRWDAARAHLAAAEASARGEGDKVSLAFTLEARANLDFAITGRPSGRDSNVLLTEARSLFEASGMSGEAERIASRLADPADKPRATASSLPAELSRREAEVLRLVAAGKTNRQIAQDLFISEKTVINHLTSILSKTGAENRAGAAVFAVRHGLA